LKGKGLRKAERRGGGERKIKKKEEVEPVSRLKKEDRRETRVE